METKEELEMVLHKLFEAVFESRQKHDADGVAKVYTKDGVLMMPDFPAAVGKDGIRSLVENSIELVKKQKMLAYSYTNYVIEELQQVQDEMFYSRGTTLVCQEEENSQHYIRWLVTVKKEDAEWKLHRVLWNKTCEDKGHE